MADIVFLPLSGMRQRITDFSARGNDGIKQDYRRIKKKMKISLYFKSMKSAKAIILGVEIIHMIFIGQSGFMPLINSRPEDQYWNLIGA
jgi:transposase-like protein